MIIFEAFLFIRDHGGDKARVFVRISLYLKKYNLLIYSKIVKHIGTPKNV